MKIDHIVFVVLFVLLGCADDSSRSPDQPTVSTATASPTSEVSPDCNPSDLYEMTLVIDPPTAPTGALLHVVWPEKVPGENVTSAALILEDDDQVWLLMIGDAESEANTVPFETVGTYPTTEGYVRSSGFVRLPEPLRAGCYIVCDDGGPCGKVVVKSA